MRKYNENYVEFSAVFVKSATEICAAVHTCSLPCIKWSRDVHPRVAHTLFV